MASDKHLHADMIHVVIPDTQAKYGVPTAHLGWVGQYIAEKFGGRPNVKIIHLGDHHDMPSLSLFDRKGGKLMEGRRYDTDVKYGNEAWDILNDPIRRVKGWKPQRFKLRGNHEFRIERAWLHDAIWEGVLSYDHLAPTNDKDWEVIEFLKPVKLDGVTYAHYFQARGTGKPL